MSDAATKAYVDSLISATSGSITSTGITLSTAGSLVYNQASVFGLLTPEEIKELECLEQEYNGALKIKRIQIFKSIPSNLRQQIVDYFTIKDFALQMENPPEDAEWSRLYELRRKDSRINISGHNYRTWVGDSSTFELMLNYLTKEEIFNAHAEQSLEESLLDAKTN